MIKIIKAGPDTRDAIFSRVVPEVDVASIVKNIIEDVRERGDEALLDMTEKFDGVRPDPIRVSQEEIDEAYSLIDPEFRSILEEAAENIRTFHKNQIRSGFKLEYPDGRVLGQKITPIERVGLYVPGGSACYPSTVLMDSIPAKIAGCSKIQIVTPPNPDGKIDPKILAAADIAGVTDIFKAGGAQAVAGLAYGTESVPPVDKIVGPGNAFVAEAKKQVFGKVAIDMIAGPSEIMIIADESARPDYLAADLLSQAEHDKMASAVLITDSMSLAEAASAEVEKQLSVLPREEIARASIDKNGKIIVCSLDEAVYYANWLAPEHLELCVKDPFAMLDKIENAGSVFLGNYCPEALGDYMAGPNHTLPTGGTARFSNPLSVDDFIKKTQFSYFTEEALSTLADKVSYFAKLEGLDAHARSVDVRKKK